MGTKKLNPLSSCDPNVVMPITSLASLNAGPPLLPCPTTASDWITALCSTIAFTAETCPLVTVGTSREASLRIEMPELDAAPG